MRRHPLAINRVLLVFSLLFFGALAGGVGWFVFTVSAAEGEMRDWRQQHDAKKFIGRTADEIVVAFGNPQIVERDKNRQPIKLRDAQEDDGQILVIDLKQGVAVDWDLWVK